jgi:exodeoxyribonuclease VII large subunit
MLPNVPEYSVSDLSLALKKTVETTFDHVRVRGELSRVTIAKSGHLYSDLKDENANLNVVCWKGTVQKLPLRPEEGMEVICTGRMTTFPGSSKYQLVIESMELAGEGALLKLLEDRKKKLAAEGLFDEARKKQLPFLPKTIGVVTSPTGAVIRDIIHRIRDRFPCHIIVWPVQVQGQGAEAGITRAIQGFNKTKSENRPDLIIVARGGGSLEDLMAFNEESVVRAAAASDIPLISAVGHETDVTLIDFAADVRAPTPTGAAEMAVPVLDNLRAQLLDDETRLRQSVKRIIQDGVKTIENAARILSRPEAMIEPLAQKFDHISEKLNSAFTRRVDHYDRTLHGLSGRLQTPKSVIEKAELQFNATISQFTKLPQNMISPKKDILSSLGRMLETLSYKKTLERGYAVIKDDKGNVLSHAQNIKNADIVDITVQDGSITLPRK